MKFVCTYDHLSSDLKRGHRHCSWLSVKIFEMDKKHLIALIVKIFEMNKTKKNCSYFMTEILTISAAVFLKTMSEIDHIYPSETKQTNIHQIKVVQYVIHSLCNINLTSCSLFPQF